MGKGRGGGREGEREGEREREMTGNYERQPSRDSTDPMLTHTVLDMV